LAWIMIDSGIVMPRALPVFKLTTSGDILNSRLCLAIKITVCRPRLQHKRSHLI
jgi:hypothetical protein